MSATVEIPAPPHALKVIRLRPGYGPAWLREYGKNLRWSAEDFLRRSRLPGTAAGILALLDEATAAERAAVWLVLTADYRLRGWAVAVRSEPLGGPPVVEVVAMHLYPRPKVPRGTFQDLVATIRAWAAEVGVEAIEFQSRRARPAVWARQVGAEPCGTLYRAPVVWPRAPGEET
jgi:hypothetical protein